MRILLFISLYLAIYGGMHYYLYRSLRRGFALTGRWHIALVVFLVLMILGPLSTRGLETIEWHAAAEGWAVLVFGWMGLLVMSITLFFFIDIGRYLYRLLYFVKRQKIAPEQLPWRALISAVFVISAGASVYGYFAAKEIRIELVTISTDKLPAGITSYRMVQLTDVHLGVMTDAVWLERIVNEVNGLKPDLIVTTGDIIDSRIGSAAPYQQTLAKLQAPDGKYGVAGNHEFFAGIDKSVAFMEEAGFVMLRGSSAKATPWLHLHGVDDREGRHSGVKVEDHEAPLMQAAEQQVFNLVLKHQPVIRDESVGRFDLQLAGHVHQGQIFPFRLATWIAYPVAMGMSELGKGSSIYVSRGTGTWGPPMRVMAPPEITLFEFLPMR
ncbi:MAG: metallophosphoesterase [Chromatiales bacterium]|nr:metallophosphoesterase [Chromatiales bacterium]